jgi:hypothetical protein
MCFSWRRRADGPAVQNHAWCRTQKYRHGNEVMQFRGYVSQGVLWVVSSYVCLASPCLRIALLLRSAYGVNLDLSAFVALPSFGPNSIVFNHAALVYFHRDFRCGLWTAVWCRGGCRPEMLRSEWNRIGLHIRALQSRRKTLRLLRNQSSSRLRRHMPRQRPVHGNEWRVHGLYMARWMYRPDGEGCRVSEVVSRWYGVPSSAPGLRYRQRD